MQSTGQTSTHASQPVQLSARMTASFGKSFFFGLAAGLAAGAAICGPFPGGWWRDRNDERIISEIGPDASPAQAASSANTGFVASMHSQRTTARAYMAAKL